MKKLLICFVALIATVTLSACNRQIVDTTWKYERAIVSLPDGTVIEGKTYLVHSGDVVLISE